jgi:predicted MFS family arabinose efflux permease
MGIQDSIMSAPIAMIISPDVRSRALGIFNALYGVAWFAGSTLLGVVYGYSVGAVVVISVAAQAIGVAVLFGLGRVWPRDLRRRGDNGKDGQ